MPEAQAEADRAKYGERNIGGRARSVIYSYLALTESLASLASQLSLYLGQKDIGEFDTGEVDYEGWWRIAALKPLGFSASLGMSRHEFVGRCKELLKLLENLKPGPLKQLLAQLGMPKEEFADLKSLKLLARLCQLAKVARDRGDSLAVGCRHVLPHWSKDIVVPDMTPLFSLNEIRQLDAHTTGGDIERRLRESLKVFELDIATACTGWGLMLDAVYDRLSESLSGLASLLKT